MPYERVARLGRGAMGVVDLARRDDGTQVAVKRLTLHGSADDMARARQRIAREAAILTRLHHPGIVELLEVHDDGDDVTLVMPYLTGGTLGDRVSRHGPAPAAEVEHLADQLGAALAAAHRAGVVHRDIKPANVLFDDDGVPHLADFGVASSHDDTAGLTATGTVVGTPGFMAPEQARGEPAGRPADVFSLGATLRYAATGEGPYGRGAPELLMVRAAQGKVRRVPRSVPVGLRRRLEAMLEPRPERRPSAAAQAGGPAGTQVRRAVRRRRSRWLPVAGAAAVASVALAAAVALAARETGDPPVAGPTTTGSEACTPLPFQPCGAEPAPGTDGRSCLPGFADYDERAGNGCEAADDGLPAGALLEDLVEGTIVPRDDVDTFTMEVADRRQLLCDGRLRVSLTAPAGTSLRLDLLAGDEVLGQATSADGVAATVTLREPECVGDDTTTLLARVSPVGSYRSADPYVLERSGSF